MCNNFFTCFYFSKLINLDINILSYSYRKKTYSHVISKIIGIIGLVEASVCSFKKPRTESRLLCIIIETMKLINISLFLCYTYPDAMASFWNSIKP